jgi:PTS system mannose-specific IID component/fructoselysine and glucoselysine-specific PTS system IID component
MAGGLIESSLSERKKLILKAIVDAHIENGEPVGSKYLTKLQGGMMDKLMYVCGIVGLMVIGAMVASMVGITTPIQFASTGLVLQDIINSILPNMIDLGIVFAMYLMIKKKFQTGTLLAVCIVGGVIFNALGIFI